MPDSLPPHSPYPATAAGMHDYKEKIRWLRQKGFPEDPRSDYHLDRTMLQHSALYTESDDAVRALTNFIHPAWHVFDANYTRYPSAHHRSNYYGDEHSTRAMTLSDWVACSRLPIDELSRALKPDFREGRPFAVEALKDFMSRIGVSEYGGRVPIQFPEMRVSQQRWNAIKEKAEKTAGMDAAFERFASGIVDQNICPDRYSIIVEVQESDESGVVKRFLTAVPLLGTIETDSKQSYWDRVMDRPLNRLIEFLYMRSLMNPTAAATSFNREQLHAAIYGSEGSKPSVNAQLDATLAQFDSSTNDPAPGQKGRARETYLDSIQANTTMEPELLMLLQEKVHQKLVGGFDSRHMQSGRFYSAPYTGTYDVALGLASPLTAAITSQRRTTLKAVPFGIYDHQRQVCLQPQELGGAAFIKPPEAAVVTPPASGFEPTSMPGVTTAAIGTVSFTMQPSSSAWPHVALAPVEKEAVKPNGEETELVSEKQTILPKAGAASIEPPSSPLLRRRAVLVGLAASMLPTTALNFGEERAQLEAARQYMALAQQQLAMAENTIKELTNQIAVAQINLAQMQTRDMQQNATVNELVRMLMDTMSHDADNVRQIATLTRQLAEAEEQNAALRASSPPLFQSAPPSQPVGQSDALSGEQARLGALQSEILHAQLRLDQTRDIQKFLRDFTDATRRSMTPGFNPFNTQGLAETDVESIQRAFSLRGADLGKYGQRKDGIDGELGRYTAQAIMKFKEEQNLHSPFHYVDGEFLTSLAAATAPKNPGLACKLEEIVNRLGPAQGQDAGRIHCR